MHKTKTLSEVVDELKRLDTASLDDCQLQRKIVDVISYLPDEQDGVSLAMLIRKARIDRELAEKLTDVMDYFTSYEREQVLEFATRIRQIHQGDIPF